MKMIKRAFIIAGVSSGAGKTTATLGIMEAFRRRGLVVQPFKAGPDYIDPGHHAALLGRPSYNLDTWMMGRDGVEKTFLEKAPNADVAIIEGVMGLFDGRADAEGSGSTAQLSKVIGAPVLLVVDGAKMAQSAGAIIEGFERHDPGVNVRWVVFNRVASERHYRMLKGSIPSRSKVECLGFLPNNDGLAMPSRHLGLITSSDIDKRAWKRFVKTAGDAVVENVAVARLLARATRLKKIHVRPEQPETGRVRIAVAKDRAFCFYYEENLEILKAQGAEIVLFSPIKDKKLPSRVDGLYIGGGYPELFAKELEANLSLRQEIKKAASLEMPIFAECGGLMYLGQGIRDRESKNHKCAGVFPWTTRMLKKRKALGYREAAVSKACPMLPQGGLVRGHEYHYSEIRGVGATKTVFTIVADGTQKRAEGYSYKNTLATYVHIHFASNPAFAAGFVQLCEESRLNHDNF
ncbi:MAG: cobyrinate a,c-diamide synthase [Deltaproteobacteria bacterium]|nr:cobyrinate a,c-diamide synthase [Deltaproteobacteria bacterium]